MTHIFECSLSPPKHALFFSSIVFFLISLDDKDHGEHTDLYHLQRIAHQQKQ